MDLLLKRNRRGRKFELFAKYELTPEEQAIISTSTIRDEVLWSVSRQGQPLAQWALRILGIPVGLAVGIGLAWGLRPPFILVALAPWVGMFAGVVFLPKLVNHKLHDEVRVRHLLTGVTMTGNEEELLAKESMIQDMGKKVSTYLEDRKSRGTWDDSSERIAL